MADSSSSLPIIGAFMNMANSSNQSAADYANQRQAADEQYSRNKELAKYQNELNMQSWLQQQAYNTPANQMARFKAAGLNPNLIYGQGNSGNASSPVQLSAGQPYDVPVYHSRGLPDMVNVVGTWLDTKAKLKNLEILDSQAVTAAANARVADQTANNRIIQSQFGVFGDTNGEFERDYSRSPMLLKYNHDALKKEFTAAAIDLANQKYKRQEFLNRLDYSWMPKERKLKYDRSNLSFVREQKKAGLEQYTNDPMWYYGEKLVDGILNFLPIGRFSKAVKGMSTGAMTDHLRGRGFSVRKNVPSY